MILTQVHPPPRLEPERRSREALLAKLREQGLDPDEI
jgi:hypothetical protein